MFRLRVGIRCEWAPGAFSFSTLGVTRHTASVAVVQFGSPYRIIKNGFGSPVWVQNGSGSLGAVWFGFSPSLNLNWTAKSIFCSLVRVFEPNRSNTTHSRTTYQIGILFFRIPLRQLTSLPHQRKPHPSCETMRLFPPRSRPPLC